MLFERYLQSLLAFVRERISPKLAARFDAEDVVQSAYRSFFGGLGNGRYLIEGEDALWGLLVAITMHKLQRQIAHHHAQKRTVLIEQPPADDGSTRDKPPEVAARAQAPHEALALADEIERIKSPLTSLQQCMLELRLQGHSIKEIAEHTSRSDRTVQRLLEKVRAELQLRLRQSVGV